MHEVAAALAAWRASLASDLKPCFYGSEALRVALPRRSLETAPDEWEPCRFQPRVRSLREARRLYFVCRDLGATLEHELEGLLRSF